MALPPVLDEENLYKFRTKICERYVKQGKCEFADKCQYSHDLRWTRRPPWKYTYAPELCRELVFVTDGRGRTVAKSNCKQKRYCRFSHTKEEQMYHPKVYKTTLCHQFKENGWCDRYYCPFAHSDEELRHVDQPSEARRICLTPAEQEAACPEIYLPSDRPHPRLRARFLALMDGLPTQNHLHLTLDPTLCSNHPGGRTRQPYTDFISSHTPHSVTSECSSPSTARQNHQPPPGLYAADKGPGVIAVSCVGEPMMPAAKDGSQPLSTFRHQGTTKETSGERRAQKTTNRLVQLLHAKQSAGGQSLAAKDFAPVKTTQSSVKHPAHEAHPDAATTAVAALASAVSTLSDSARCSSGFASTQSAVGHQSTQRQNDHRPAVHAAQLISTHMTRVEAAATDTRLQNPQFESLFLPPLWQSGRSVGAEEASQGVSELKKGIHFGLVSSNAESSDQAKDMKNIQLKIDQCAPEPLGAQSGALWNSRLSAYRVKYLTNDICYWDEPIGRSRDDPSVLVYAGLWLGPNKRREIVAVKQLPVVVPNRVRDLWAEVNRFTAICSPQLVNIKRALLLPGEAGEGTSLWVVTEKCKGSITSMFPVGPLSVSFLRSTFPFTGLNGLLHHIIEAVQTLHQQSGSAHMRIHPANIMIGCHGEVKLGDCAGKIRYLSILDLLHAGIQGASNAKALLQWILGTPHETGWMAPEFLTSLAELDKQLSEVLWQCSASPDDNKNEQEFIELARRFRWHPEMLRRADAWCTGVTLFYIATGGLHPYGDINDPTIIMNILTDKKVNFEKVSNCPWLSDLLAGLLCNDPLQRLTLSQALRHPLFWYSEDIEKYLFDLASALDDTTSKELSQLREALAYGINWVESLSTIPAPSPLLPLLLYYMALPSASPQLLAAYPTQSASSFLIFLAYVAADRRLSLSDRRLIVSECLMVHASPFLHSVHLFFFPKVLADTIAAATVASACCPGLSTPATMALDPSGRSDCVQKSAFINSILSTSPGCGFIKQDVLTTALHQNKDVTAALYPSEARPFGGLTAAPATSTPGTVNSFMLSGKQTAATSTRSQTRASVPKNSKEFNQATAATGSKDGYAAVRDDKDATKRINKNEPRQQSAAAVSKTSIWSCGRDTAAAAAAAAAARPQSKRTPVITNAVRESGATEKIDKETSPRHFTANQPSIEAESTRSNRNPAEPKSADRQPSNTQPKPRRSSTRGTTETKGQGQTKNRGVTTKSTCLPNAAAGSSSPSSRAVPEVAAPRCRSLTLNHNETTTQTSGSNVSLLQMPVAVSTVSTALSAPTIDFCHGPSQVTEATAGSFWTQQTPHGSNEAITGVVMEQHAHSKNRPISQEFDIERLGRAESSEKRQDNHMSKVCGKSNESTDSEAVGKSKGDACSIQ